MCSSDLSDASDGDEDEWDDEDEDEDWDDESSFTMNVKSKGAQTIQDMIRAELAEINREGG